LSNNPLCPYIATKDFNGYDYLRTCDYSVRYAKIYDASDDLVNGVISCEYDGECDESEESEEDEVIDWEEEERKIYFEEMYIDNENYSLKIREEEGGCDYGELALEGKLLELKEKHLKKSKERLAKFKLASKNALFKESEERKMVEEIIKAFA
jgi:hypothetical protein